MPIYCTATCSISRCGIQKGEEVLLAIMNRPYNTYDLLDFYIRVKNRYPNANHRDPEFLIDHSLFRFIGIGKNTRNGEIDTFCDDHVYYDNHWQYRIMIHKAVAENCLGRELNPDNLEQDMIDLINIAEDLGIDLTGAVNLGKESLTTENLELQKRLVEFMVGKINEQIQQSAEKE